MKTRKTIPEKDLAREGVLEFVAVILGFVAIVLGLAGGAVWVSGAVACVIAVLVWRFMLRKQRRAKLAADDWERCMHCFFDLRGLPQDGTCPECGEKYEKEDVRLEWKYVTGNRARKDVR